MAMIDTGYRSRNMLTPEQIASSIAEDTRIEQEARRAEQKRIASALTALQEASERMETALASLNTVGMQNIGSLAFDDMLSARGNVADAAETLRLWFQREIERRS